MTQDQINGLPNGTKLMWISPDGRMGVVEVGQGYNVQISGHDQQVQRMQTTLTINGQPFQGNLSDLRPMG